MHDGGESGIDYTCNHSYTIADATHKILIVASRKIYVSVTNYIYYFATEAQQYNSTLAEMAEHHIRLCMAVRQGEVHKLSCSGRLPLGC